MCGIAGIAALGATAGRPVPLEALQCMADLQAHRGPDGEGFLASWREDGGYASAFMPKAAAWGGRADVAVGLAHRRLAILDLSERGRQPMTVGDGSAWIVFNGEIYNHRVLRDELSSLGHAFVTRTDTEVLLQAYRAWGEDCLPRLRGMFAFAIWDAARGRLFCARDRLGIKPFYYVLGDGTFAFASEMKALLAVPGVTPEADDDAVIEFLVHGNCDYGERTLLRRVRALAPAHALTVDIHTGRADGRPYWRLAPRNPGPAAARNGTSAPWRALRALLTETTADHLVSDVRVGSCLSGGLDSSTVVALIGAIRRDAPDAAAAVGERFHTFTACWDDPAFDERAYAMAAAGAAGASPSLVFPTADDFLDSFARMAWHQDMPFGEPTYYAQWRVMRAAKEAGVKVLVDGQGGDEVFGGYAKFRYAYLMSLLRAGRAVRLGGEVGAMLRQGDGYVLNLRNGYRYLPRPLRRLFGVDSLLREALRADWDRAVSAESTPGTRWWRYAASGGAPEDGPAMSVMQRMQVDDIRTDTLPMLLRMEDRSSMAFSLEARVPLLDHEVVEVGLSLPDDLKIRGGFSKYAIRRAMDGLLPDQVRMRTTKLGFAVPGRTWLTGALRPQVSAMLHDTLRAARYVDPEVLRRWYGSSRAAGAPKEAYLGLFRVLSLEMWMRAFHVA